jgi:exosortase A-associated hydrolase 2
LSHRLRGQFIAGEAGPLAVVLWEPPVGTPLRCGALFLPPFGDEMNKSRRTVAMQARALAAAGCAVAVLDPRGTGDSAGDHRDATWDGWHCDVRVAWDWLAQCVPAPRALWGLRLGCVLACEAVVRKAVAASVLLLWQPVASGRLFFDQLLRVSTAKGLLGASDAGPDSRSLRHALQRGQAVELAGYEIDPALVAGAESFAWESAAMPGMPVLIRETTMSDPPTASASASRIAEQLRRGGAVVDLDTVTGPSFWASLEIAEAPHLVTATTTGLQAMFSAREAASS